MTCLQLTCFCGLAVLLLLVPTVMPINNFNMNLLPRQLINAEHIGYTFRENRTISDHFKILEFEGDSLLVGARNAVYNLSLEGLKLNQKLDWASTPYDVQMCMMKGKSEEECHNYIRVLVRQPQDGKVLMCGTNAYTPLCRQYNMEDGQYQMHREFSGFAISPYDPRHNSTAFYSPENDVLYTGTVSDFTAADPLIYRTPLQSGDNHNKAHSTKEVEELGLRTGRNDLKILNEPNFVSSFEDKDHVYFWFREIAAEYSNLGKAVFPRVARVCKKDQGGPRNDKNLWTSFVKARLNCSIPGDIPFYFHELQAATSVIKGKYGDKEAELVYAVFTTNYNAIQASAVCAFRMEDVRHIFTHGAFKTQSTPTSQWLPTHKNELPTPRPGSCSDDSRSLNDKVVNFITHNPLMHDAVPNFFQKPLVIDSKSSARFTQIAVHSQVTAVSGHKYDVMFIGTEDGKVMKFVNAAQGNKAISVHVETVQVFRHAQSIDNLRVYSGKTNLQYQTGDFAASAIPVATDPRLIAVSRDEVRSLPLHYCANVSSCAGCVRLRDPYCAWNTRLSVCEGRTEGSWYGGDFIQDIPTGRSPMCPEGDIEEPELYAVNELYPQRVTTDTPNIYSAESMAIAVVLTLAVAIIFGFAVGYRLAKLRHDSAAGSPGSSVYDSATLLRSKLPNQCNDVSNHVDLFLQPNSKLNETGHLVMLPESKAEKNSFILNNGTLPKDYKSRKVYL